MDMSFIKVFLDWTVRTRTLSAAEKGRLIDAMVAYASTGIEPELPGAERHVFPAFQAQIDIDRKSLAECSARCSANGKKGGRPRKNSADEESEQKPKKPRLFSESEQKPKKLEEEKEKEKEKECNPPSPLELRFDRFWSAYPNKVGKRECRRWWAKEKPDEDMLLMMLSAIDRQKRGRQWTEDAGAYIPHPHTWLNRGSWEDEAPEEPKQRTQTYKSVNEVFG